MPTYYSAKNNGFYSTEVSGDSLPDDAAEITQDEWISLLQGQAEGQMITSDKKGKPVLKNYPNPTSEQYVEMASLEKSRLLAAASSSIDPLQDAVDLDIATSEEVAMLKAWKTYRVMVSRVDISKAPGIDWPKSPSSQ